MVPAFASSHPKSRSIVVFPTFCFDVLNTSRPSREARFHRQQQETQHRYLQGASCAYNHSANLGLTQTTPIMSFSSLSSYRNSLFRASSVIHTEKKPTVDLRRGGEYCHVDRGFFFRSSVQINPLFSNASSKVLWRLYSRKLPYLQRVQPRPDST